MADGLIGHVVDCSHLAPEGEFELDNAANIEKLCGIAHEKTAHSNNLVSVLFSQIAEKYTPCEMLG